MPASSSSVDVPEGLEFLRLIWAQEDSCETRTDTELPRLGVKAPACVERIGTILSLLDRMASCWWVCRKGDHLIEYLCGRVASSARATLRLVRFGFYDEALSLCRSIGEVANLLCLFNEDPDAFQAWRTASRSTRLKEFSPLKVRTRLEQLNQRPPIDQERYRLLSEVAAHVHPDTKPQSHNLLGVPMAGAAFQDQGLLVCVNELAWALVFSVAFATPLLEFPESVKDRISAALRELIEQIGGATITDIGDFHREVLENAEARKELETLAARLKREQARRRTALKDRPQHDE